MFLIRLRFPSQQSIAQIILKHYGSVMQGNNFKNNEKRDYKVCKNQPNFLKTLSKNGLTPKVLNFKLTNSNLFYSNTCKKCQFLLLKEEIKSRVSVSIR